MNLVVPPGKYVVAVSGGVDSVVLLHILMQDYADSPSNDFVVAHFDHGIRADSADDCVFVQKLAAQYELTFEFERAELGAGASEADARTARYAFLKSLQKKHKAAGIITAHHQDDVLETIIINWLRGTKSRGLSSLRSTPEMCRPLLGWPKQQIYDYAHLHKLAWREDSTNDDETYLRNYIRRNIMPKLSATDRTKLLAHSEKAAGLNDAIARLTADYLQQCTTAESLNRQQFVALPEPVAREVLASWLRLHTPAVITTKLLTRLTTAIRTGRNNSLADIEQGYSFKIQRNSIELLSPK